MAGHNSPDDSQGVQSGPSFNQGAAYGRDQLSGEDFESVEEEARRESIEAGIAELRARLAEAQAALQSVAGDMLEIGRQKAAGIDDSVRDSIERQPYTAVLIAALIGFVLGSVNARH
jgi:ElaB/YqjD/DUF883 family membrane-anchored ribosome-binding protein